LSGCSRPGWSGSSFGRLTTSIALSQTRRSERRPGPKRWRTYVLPYLARVKPARGHGPTNSRLLNLRQIARFRLSARQRSGSPAQRHGIKRGTRTTQSTYSSTALDATVGIPPASPERPFSATRERDWGQSACSKNVRLMRCPSTQFRGHHSVESDSRKTFEFSARKSCVKKRM
jgi:hypothetical protein